MNKQYYYQIMSLEDLPGEEWKTIEVATLYSISNFGRVKAETCEKWHSNSKRLRFYPAHIMAQGINNMGYLIVSLINNNGKLKMAQIGQIFLKDFMMRVEIKKCKELDKQHRANIMEEARHIAYDFKRWGFRLKIFSLHQHKGWAIK